MTLRRRRLAGIALIGAVVGAAIVAVIAPNPFQHDRGYWAQMDSAQGLARVGRDVRVAGVTVGEIRATRREGDDARIELVLHDDHIIVHRDAEVHLRPHLLFEGSSFVDLDPGSPSAPPLAPGSTIPTSQTSHYVTLDEALRILRPRIRRQLASLGHSAAQTLRGDAVAGVQRTLRSAPSLTRHVAGVARALQGPDRRELAATIRGSARTLDALAAKEALLAPALRRLARTSAGLATDDGAPLDASLAELPGTLQTLRDVAPMLERTTHRLDRFGTQAAPALPDFARALAGVRPVIARATPVLRRGTPLVDDARTIATGLARADALTTMLRLIPEPLSALQGLLATLTRKTRYGTPTYEQLGSTFAGAAAVVRSYQTAAQNPDGPGHGARAALAIAPNPAMTGFRTPGSRDRVRTHVSCDAARRIAPRAARQLRDVGACR